VFVVFLLIVGFPLFVVLVVFVVIRRSQLNP
jgi:hypothetical protein